MNVRAACLALACALFAGPAAPQGFAGLGSDAEGFAMPDPDYRLTFPEDHGPHPEFRIEWWYVTANLEGPDGTPYGIQWTLFRAPFAPDNPEGWDNPQIWMGHAALTTETEHFVAERFARGGIGQAGVTAEPFEAFIDEWTMAGPSLSNVSLTAQGTDFSYVLRLETDKPFVPQGIEGFSVKAPNGMASHYYSQPFYEVTGTLTLPQGEIPVTGTAWLDREWSSQLLAESQTGWDWFSLAFEDGARMMGFRLRDTAGPDFTAATWITPDGVPTPFPDGAFRIEPLTVTEVAGRDVPTRWRVQLADKGVDVTVEALNPQAWMTTAVAYWEGPVTFAGSHSGRGYLEMTGYE